MRKLIGVIILFLTLITAASATYFFFGRGQTLNLNYSSDNITRVWENIKLTISGQQELYSPFVSDQEFDQKQLPLNKYTLTNLSDYPYQTSKINLIEITDNNQDFITCLFKYQTMDQTMTGQAHIPTQAVINNNNNQKSRQPLPVIIMVRGYAEPSQYQPGFGTKNAAAVLAQNGYITLAPDFFGFADSDPEPDNEWLARFIKPINIIELIRSVQNQPQLYFDQAINDSLSAQQIDLSSDSQSITLNPNQISMWGHSNGGQIAISVLQILSEPIPTTTWAPMTAPFPYSILFFTRTSPDEGQEARAWLAQFEQDYNVLEFSITQHAAALTGPLQIHHGHQDQQALSVWSDNFVELLEQENKKRQQLSLDPDQASSPTTQFNNNQADSFKPPQVDRPSLEPIDFNYFVYPQADHNLQPSQNWQQAIERDLNFFKQYLNS